MTTTLRRTKLYEEHKKQGAKLVEFGGWEMPISYEGVIAEHQTVRNSAGIFDVSHMGEIFVEGQEAFKFLQWMTVNDIARLKDGTGQYSALLNPEGGMIDDLIIYRLKENKYLLCVNASNTDKDFKWLKEHAGQFKTSIVNDSENWSQLAVQGPKSKDAVLAVLDAKDHDRLSAMEYMEIATFKTLGDDVLIARTGYTGEHGYEIYLPNRIAPKLWNDLLATSPRTGIKPIGLGARDTLRLEACYLLYGNDMDDHVSPLQVGISWAVRLEKGDFIGKDQLMKEKGQGVSKKMVAFVMEEKGIARHDMDIYNGARLIGKVTSASYLPTLDVAGGMALIDSDGAKIDDNIEIDIRGKRKLAKVVKRPLYSARTK